MNYRGLLSRRGGPGPEQGYRARGDISHLLFVTARPGIQLLWTILVVATLAYTLARSGPKQPGVVALMMATFVLVILGNHFFPFDEYRPVLFFFLMAASLTLTGSIVFLTGNRDSLLAFLFFAVPIFASAYYGYPGTLLMSLLTGVARYVPFMSGHVTGLQQLSLALSAATYVFIGMMSCYVVEGEKMYARESNEYRHLLELSRHKERDISRIYNLSRRFSYTLDLDTILKTTAALARQMLASEGALVFLLEKSRPVLKAALGILPFSDMASVAPPDGSAWMKKLAGGETVIEEKVALEWLPLPPESTGRKHNFAAVPLFTGGDVTGYLMCFSPAARPFRESNLEILSTIASQAAVAVEKAQLYAETLDDKTKVETILSALRDGLALTDAQGMLVDTNPVAARMLTFDSTMPGTRLTEVLSRVVEDSDLGHLTINEAVEAALEGRTVFGEMTLAGETRMTVQSHFIPLRDQLSRVSGVVLFLHDITELKRVDELKSNFVTNVSHELRTPLTSISGFVSLLLAGRAGQLTANQEKYLDVVKEQAGTLTKMIEDLLDLSRLQARRTTVGSQKADVRQLASAAVKQLAKAAKDGSVEVRLNIRDDLPGVDGDAVRLSQVLVNIIGNAIKFTDPGGLVEVGALFNGSFVQVKVSDTGSGISPSAIPHIFDRFFQAHPGEKTDKGGFGLGLAISREIVELHGGRIWAESDPGRGSTFYFTLPVFVEYWRRGQVLNLAALRAAGSKT
jgi:two-component system phosphate regulon sensor histidine kinase PhoR